jgi:metal-responsive CopG/Arc/MetJ family transcriptional regulator
MSISFHLAIITSMLYVNNMTTNKPKLLFVIPQELLDRIDDFRFNNRINSRSEAVRRLIESGLESAKPKGKKK